MAGERQVLFWPVATGQICFTITLTTIVSAKAAISGWAGQIALARPKSHAPAPTTVAIRVAARVLLVEAFMRSDPSV